MNRNLLMVVISITLTGCDKMLWQHKDHPVSGATVQSDPEGGTPVPTGVMLVCGGQSNMYGIGQIVPLENDTLVTRIGSDLQGPCVAAANILAHNPTPRRVVAVQCAVGGTSIDEWGKGDKYYEACIDKVKTAQTKYGVLQFAGFIFYQGEEDYKDTTDSWPTKFTAMVRSFQAQLSLGNAPVVYAQIGAEECLSPADQAQWGHFQEVQTSAQQLGIEMITTKDLHTSDCIHHADTYGEIGQRFANALLED